MTRDSSRKLYIPSDMESQVQTVIVFGLTICRRRRSQISVLHHLVHVFARLAKCRKLRERGPRCGAVLGNEHQFACIIPNPGCSYCYAIVQGGTSRTVSDFLALSTHPSPTFESPSAYLPTELVRPRCKSNDLSAARPFDAQKSKMQAARVERATPAWLRTCTLSYWELGHSMGRRYHNH